jgi:hypothetical protein
MSALPTNVRSRSLERLNTDVAFGPFMTQTGSGGGAVTRDGLSVDLMMLFFAQVRRLFRHVRWTPHPEPDPGSMGA